VTRALAELFAEINRAERGNVYLIETTAALEPIIVQIAADTSASQAACGGLSPEIAQHVEAACQKAGVALLRPPYGDAVLPGAIADSKLGIGEATYAIAGTGTIAQVTTVEAERLVSVLCWAHICVLRASRIVEHASDTAALLRNVFKAHQSNCAVTYTTGPSRSADIEFKIQMGIHGPQQTHTIVLLDL